MKSSFKSPSADTVIVLDFETTGLSPSKGDRAIEIGAVKLENGIITERFQRLMNPGFRISYFIENYTGISNQMLQQAPPCHEIMADFANFIEGFNLVAHNASFDKRFLEAEFAYIGKVCQGDFACSMLSARRVYQEAPNHKLGSLVHYKNISHQGIFHRALADAEMTAQLWLLMLEDIKEHYKIPHLAFAKMQRLAKVPKREVNQFFSNTAKIFN